MIVLRLAGGGRIAVRPEDVALAQASPWGATIIIGSDGSRFEVEHSLSELRKFFPSLWFNAGTTIFSPDHISSIWEDGDRLSYLVSGVHMTQEDANLDDFVEAIEKAKADRNKIVSELADMEPNPSNNSTL